MTPSLRLQVALYVLAIVLCLVAAHLALDLVSHITSLAWLSDLLGRIPGAGQ